MNNVDFDPMIAEKDAYGNVTVNETACCETCDFLLFEILSGVEACAATYEQRKEGGDCELMARMRRTNGQTKKG